MAEAAAGILPEHGHENTEYSSSNTANTCIQQVAEFLSEIAGKEISYINPDPAVSVETLTTDGVPAE